jgi:hypothetical protein
MEKVLAVVANMYIELTQHGRMEKNIPHVNTSPPAICGPEHNTTYY